MRLVAAVAALTFVLAAPQVRAVQQATQTTAKPAAPIEKITLTAGRSKVLDLPFDMGRVSVTDGEIAEPVPVDTRELLINGKKPGTTSLTVWGPSGSGIRIEYEL